MVWVSLEAKTKWENAIQLCYQMVQELEILSVENDQRPCSWQTIKKEALPSFTKRNAEHGMFTLPVRFIGSFNGFIHFTPAGDSDVYCIVSKSLKDALKFIEYFDAGDHDGQGAMLGFPKCCREAFAKNWAAGYFDHVWQMTDRDNPHPLSNPILRYIGLRVGFHIPCSFHCEPTIKIAEQRLATAPDQEIVKLLVALLSMPMSWEAYRGQAIIRTPIFYFIQYTVPTFKKYLIELKGTFIPRESVNGNRFPFSKKHV
jgi:hypothetical protein